MIDTTIQYGEDLDTKTRDFEYPDKEEEENDEQNLSSVDPN